MTTPALLHLIWLASPALPVGGFSYSEGLEAGVECGQVHDEASATVWVIDQLHLGLARSDLAVIAQAMPAWQASDWARVQQLNDWVLHTRETHELRRQTEQMGKSLSEWARQFDPQAADTPANLAYAALLKAQLRTPSYPVVCAAVAAFSGASCADALSAHAFGWAENMVQAAIKSVPLGQSAGQRMLARLCTEIPAAVTLAQSLDDDSRQAFTPMLAIHSARHETQYSRLFRS
jgi:urease accessory protein